MILKTKFNIGLAEFEAEVPADTLKECLFIAGGLVNTRDKCDACDNDDSNRFRLTANKGGDYTFVKIRCLECGATSDLGSYNPEGSGYFWKEFEKYEPEEKKGK